VRADSKVSGRDPNSQLAELAVEVFAMLADRTRVRRLPSAGDVTVVPVLAR